MHLQQDYSAGYPTLWVARLTFNPVLKHKDLLATQEPLCVVEAELGGERGGGGQWVLTVIEQELLLGLLRTWAVPLFRCESVSNHSCQVKGFLYLGVDAGQHPNVASDLTAGSIKLAHTWSKLAIGAVFQHGSAAPLSPPTIITGHLHVHPCRPLQVNSNHYIYNIISCINKNTETAASDFVWDLPVEGQDENNQHRRHQVCEDPHQIELIRTLRQTNNKLGSFPWNIEW